MKHVFIASIISILPFLSFAQDLEFTLPISVSDGANTTNITVAVSPNGSSTTFIEGLDQLAPPAPPDGAFDARMKVPAAPATNGISYFTKYFDNALTEKKATFEYSASAGNGPITLSWDQEALDIVGTFTITDPFTGTLFTQSMNNLDGSYTIPTSSDFPLNLIQERFNLVFTPSGQHSYTQDISATSSHFRLLSAANESTTLETLLSNNNIFTQCFEGASRPDCSGTTASANVFFYSTSTDSWNAATNINQSIPSGTAVLVYKYENDDQTPAGPGFPTSITSYGTAPSGDINPAINANAEGFTLVGNPYGSTIDSDEFTYDEVNQVVWVYDHEFNGPFNDGNDADATNTTAGGWRTWNGSAGSLTNGLLSTFQGFFVQTATGASSPSLTIPASSKTSEDADLYSTEQPNPALRIASRVNQVSISEFWLSFGEDGTIDRNQKDAIALSPLDYADHLMMYTLVDDTPVSTKNLPSLIATGTVLPLHINAWEAIDGEQAFAPATGTVEMQWDHLDTLPSTLQIFLQDHETGTVIDMRSQNGYTFTISDNAKQLENLAYSKKIRAHNVKNLTDARFSLVFNEMPTSLNPESELPSVVALHQNYPNPFNPATQISFDLPTTQSVTLSVFDITGRKVAEIANGTYPAGTHTIRFDATPLSSGMYIYHLSTKDHSVTKSMTLLK